MLTGIELFPHVIINDVVEIKSAPCVWPGVQLVVVVLWRNL